MYNEWPNSRVYLNVHLTLDNKRILRETKDKARELDYKYVWVNDDGLILIRKNDNSSVLTIRSLDDISRLAKEGRSNPEK